MIEAPIVPSDPKELQRFLTEYLGSVAGVLQALGSGMEYPQGRRTAKAQYWDDEVKSFSSARVTGASQPTWAAIKNDIYGFRFSATAMNELWLSPFHIGHTYKPNTKVYPHIHWINPGTNTGVVRWGFEYTVAKGHQQGTDSIFPESTTIYLEQAAKGTRYEHMIVEASDDQAFLTNIEPDTLILTRVFRDAAHPNDTCTDAVFGLMSDLHYQKGYWATRNKSPNFYE